MKNIYIVANWKSNKTVGETKQWFKEFLKKEKNIGSKIIVVCPPFTSLYLAKELTANSPLKIGAQNTSAFGRGAYTGEINAAQVKELADYVIIGHSERRNNFLENDEILEKKVDFAISAGLIPIFCVQNENTKIPSNIKIVAYEPVFAIGSGVADTPQNAQKVASSIKSKNPFIEEILYGGSVTKDNIKSFVEQKDINGVLVGGASLDPSSFTDLIINAS